MSHEHIRLLVVGAFGAVVVLASCGPSRPAAAADSGKAAKGEEETVKERWHFHYADSIDSIWFDVQTIEKTDSSGRRVWLRHKFVSSQSSDWAFAPIDRLMERWEFRCGTRMLRRLESAASDSTGRSVGMETRSTEWRSAVPETRGEGMLNGACAL